MDFADGAAPMGLIFFAIMAFGAFRKKAGHVVARAAYPGLAERLGLEHSPSPYKNGVGKIHGNYEGYLVTVDPDDQRRIFVRFSGAPEVELHSYEHNKRPNPGLKSFRPPTGVLSGQFKTAHASDDMMENFLASERLPALLKPLKFLRELKTLSVTPGGVTAVFDYGSPPFIPAGIVDDVLPRLVGLAGVFEPGHPDLSLSLTSRPPPPMNQSSRAR